MKDVGLQSLAPAALRGLQDLRSVVVRCYEMFQFTQALCRDAPATVEENYPFRKPIKFGHGTGEVRINGNGSNSDKTGCPDFLFLGVIVL